MKAENNNDINFWPAFTDILTSAFVFFLFLAVILLSRNFFDLKELYSLKDIKDDVKKRLEVFEKQFPKENAEIVNNEIKIILDKETQISFRPDRSDILSIENKEGIIKLKTLGQQIKCFLDNNDTNKLFGVIIEGYTDRVQSDEYNFNLSYHRAKNIMLFWQDSCGLDPNIYDISPVGYGELPSRLKQFTQDDYPLEKNRRIEIRLAPKFGELFK